MTENIGLISSMATEGADRKDQEEGQVHVPEERGWSKFWAYVGPGFLVAIAYIDPANFESDLKAGAAYQYSLLWVLLLASLAGLLIQSLSANLGIVTGKHLAQHCRAEYPRGVNLALWVIAEIEIIASDIPEVIGTAFALNMLFGIRLWAGVIITGFSTLLFLGLQRFGVRNLEVFIALLVMVIACCFFIEMGHAPVDGMAVLEGMFVPRIQDLGALAIAISLIGALVMPHNLFLHSALVLSRKHQRTAAGIKDGCLYSLLEVAAVLIISIAFHCPFLHFPRTRIRRSSSAKPSMWLSSAWVGRSAPSSSLPSPTLSPHTSPPCQEGCLYSLLEVTAALIISFAINVAVICDGCLYSLLEVAAALIISFAINVAVICVGGAVCSAPDLSPDVQASCSDISLSNAYFLLRDVLGAWASTLFGIALLASGQSSTITGTYAGQYVMSGFLELHLASWLRNLLTRLVAIVPSLAVAIVAGSTGAGNLIIASSIILSFGLPYALIPLLKFTSSPVKMGPFTNHPTVTVAAYIIGTVVIFVNCMLVVQACVEYLVSDHIPQAARIPLGIAIALVLLIYVVSLAMLARRPVTEVTYISANEGSSVELDAYMGSPPHDFGRSGGDGEDDEKGELEGGEERREEGREERGEGGSIAMTNGVEGKGGDGGRDEGDDGGEVETREGLQEDRLYSLAASTSANVREGREGSDFSGGRMKREHDAHEAVVYARNLNEYNAAALELSRSRKPYLLRTLYGDMLMDGVQPNFVTFHAAITACMRANRLHDLVFFFNQMRARGITPDRYIFNCVMTTYSRSGHVERVFRVDWDMRAAGRPPNIRTYHALLTACTTTGRFDKAAEVQERMSKDGVAMNKFCYAALIAMHQRVRPSSPRIVAKIFSLLEQSLTAPTYSVEPDTPTKTTPATATTTAATTTATTTTTASTASTTDSTADHPADSAPESSAASAADGATATGTSSAGAAPEAQEEMEKMSEMSEMNEMGEMGEMGEHLGDYGGREEQAGGGRGAGGGLMYANADLVVHRAALRAFLDAHQLQVRFQSALAFVL
ncbi:unnamed protein product [Closterium sp. NIES-65]|nr:unnamed protein product [Closterium sp. NIES-65]